MDDSHDVSITKDCSCLLVFNTVMHDIMDYVPPILWFALCSVYEPVSLHPQNLGNPPLAMVLLGGHSLLDLKRKLMQNCGMGGHLCMSPLS